MDSLGLNQNNVFNIISWNIRGLKTRLKLTDQTILNTKLKIKSVKSNLSKFNIICLQETWAKGRVISVSRLQSTFNHTEHDKQERSSRSISFDKKKHSDFVSQH